MENTTHSYDHNAILNAALTAYSQGDKALATKLAKQATQERPDDAEGWSIYGLAVISADVDTGRAALIKATNMEPGEPRWHLHLGTGLMELGDAETAQPALAKAAELSQGHPEAMQAWANSLMMLNRFGDAAQVYGRVLQSVQTPEVWIKAGDALMGANDSINAAEAYERAHTPDNRPPEMMAKLADINIMLNQYDKAEAFNTAFLTINPDDPDGGLRAANLKRWAGDHEAAKGIQKSYWQKAPHHAGLITALLDDKDAAPLEDAIALSKNFNAPELDRRRVSFALARHYDREGNEESAWYFAERANGLYDEPYTDLSREEAWLEKALTLYSSLPTHAPNASKLIYVVGPPRCGGSLLQTILARVDGVASVGERGALMAWMVPGLDDPTGLAGSLGKLAGSDLAGMARASGNAKIYVDKASPHIIFAGLLSKIHADAKFVLPNRNRQDMAISMFFHDFPDEFMYTRSIKGISEYLKFQDKAAQAWREAGVTIIGHDHDKFVSDPDTRGQALFKALELPWSNDVLDIQTSDTVVRTFSTRQVRDGVSKKFLGRGSRYSEFLDKAGF